LLVALLVGLLAGVVAGYAIGDRGPLEAGALSLAAATIGGMIALLGAFGVQLRRDHRDDVRARRDRQHAVMLESYTRLVEIRRMILKLAQRRALGQPSSGGMEIDAARSHLVPHVEMIDDDEIRRLSVEALDGFVRTADAIAPLPPDQPASDDDVSAALDSDRTALDVIAARIATLERAWHGRADVPAP
jgi:hypothetical protein